MKAGDILKRIEDECVGCPPEIGCFGNSCPYKNVTRYYCDFCEDEAPLYYFDGCELCLDCIEKRLDKVEGSHY
jgi:hypothetical protein